MRVGDGYGAWDKKIPLAECEGDFSFVLFKKLIIIFALETIATVHDKSTKLLILKNEKMKKIKLKWVVILFVLVFYTEESCFSQIVSFGYEPDIIINLPETEGENSYFLDINNDGNNDYKISCRMFYKMEQVHEPLINYLAVIDSIGANRVIGGPFWFADTIFENTFISKSALLYGLIHENGGLIGHWYLAVPDTETYAYTGLKFYINNQPHYGWLRLKTNGKRITIDSYAWNSTPNQLIIAGQTE